MFRKGSIHIFLAWLMIGLLISACGEADVPESPPVDTTQFGVTPEPGTAVLQGQVISTGNRNQPLPNTEVRLAQIFWNEDRSEGAFVIEGGSSPTTRTDENGGFVFTDLPEMEYALVVGDLFGQHEVIALPDGQAVVYATTAGEVTEVGIVEVTLLPLDEIPLPTPYPVPLPAYPGP